MAVLKRWYILATSLLCGLAAITSFISLGTEEWVIGELKYKDDGFEPSEVEYGLFSGIVKQKSPVVVTYEITMTCLYGDNVCAMMCGTHEDIKTEALEKVYADESVDYDTYLADCRSNQKAFRVRNHLRDTTIVDNYNKNFINAGIWVTTIFFLVLSALMGLVSAAVAVWNTAANPIEIYFSVMGLYIYNGLAFLFTLLYILLWGIHFAVTIIDNVVTHDTIMGQYQPAGNAKLGYSYWISMVPLFLYLGGILLLYVRQVLIKKDPPAKDLIDETPDGAIMLF